MIKSVVTIITLCLINIPFLASAQGLEMRVSISKEAELNRWLIAYEFSEAVEAVSFEKTPYSFIKDDWRVQTTGAAFDWSSLQLKLDAPRNHLSIALKRENDQFVNGFYTPFLNFSDGSTAVFIGHYVPAEIKVNGAWISIRQVAIVLTISPLKSDEVLFNTKNSVSKLRVSEADVMQYAYVGRLTVKKYGKFNVILDSALPGLIQESLLKAMPEFYNYFESKTQVRLGFVPLFIINYKAGPVKPRLDGGAINKQVAINFVGDGWNQNPEANVINVLSLLSHEMAHLWNAQHWRHEDTNSVWMHEGGANYFSRKALLNFDYVSVEEDAVHYDIQSEKCIQALKKGAINNLESRADKYVCGEIVFKLSALMTDNNMHLDVWNQLAIHDDSEIYSETAFIKALYKNSANKNEAMTVEKSIRESSGDQFEALIKKYIGQSIPKTSMQSTVKASTD